MRGQKGLCVAAAFWAAHFCPSTAGAAGKTGAAFLKLPANAVAQSYGSAYAVAARDAGSVYHNPAGLAGLRRQEFQTSYGAHLEGYQHLQLAYAYPGDAVSFGVGAVRLAAGGFDGRDEQGRRTASFKAEDRAVTVGLAKAFRLYGRGGAESRLAVGAAVKHIRSSIERESAQAFAFDLGVRASLGHCWVPCAVASAARNLGGGLRFIDRSDPLPATLSVAVSIEPVPAVELLASAERRLHEDRAEFGVGLGYAIGGLLSLRGSFARVAGGGDTASRLGRLDAGVGLKAGAARLDYAFSPMGELGNVQRLTVTLAFGENRRAPRPAGRDGDLMWLRSTWR